MNYSQFVKDCNQVYGEYLNEIALPPVKNFRKRERYLFPEIYLDKPITNQGHVSVLVGDLFEILTMAFLKDSRRIASMEEGASFPDLLHKGKMIEVKATQRRRYVKVSYPQLLTYNEQGCPCDYYLWVYNAQFLFKTHRTIGELVHAVVESVARVYILPMPFLVCLAKALPANVLVRKYDSWRGYNGSGTYHCLQLGHPFLDGLYNEPGNRILATGLDPKTVPVDYRRRRLRFDYRGAEMQTGNIQVFQLFDFQS